MYLLQNKKRTLRRAASWVMAVAIFFSCLTISPVVAKAASNGDAALQADEGDVPSENLALWLRANDGVETDGTKVTSWKNQAGDNTFTVANGDGITLNSENGYNYLKFDGATALKGTSIDFNGKSAITLIVVGEYEGEDPRPDAYADMNTALFWCESGDWGSMSLGLYKEQVQMRFGLGTGSGGEALGVSRYDKYAKNGLSINMAVKEGGTHSLFINGANVLSESGKKEQTAGISQEMYIGKGISAGTDYYFKGKIAEVIVYDGVLSEDQVSIVNAYLRQKYNITDDGSEENTVNAIVSAELSPISVPKGTTREKLVLPFSIDVTLEEEFSNITQPTPSKNTKIPVVWDTSTFDPEKIGIPQDIYGTLNISLGKSVKDRTISTIVPVGNPNNVKAHVQVTVRDVERELYVSPVAEAGGDGTIINPFQSIQAARDAIRENGWNDNMKGDLIVWLAGGTYYVEEPIVFGPDDSGSNGYSIIYQAIPGEVPNLNGGVQVTGWEKWDENPNVYVADLDRDTKLRNLFVNGQAAKMTSTSAKTCGPYGSVTITGEEAWALDSGVEVAGVLLNWSELNFTVDSPDELTNPEDIEIRQQKTWNEVTIGISEIKSVTPGDDGGAPAAKAVNINTDPANGDRNRKQLDEIAEKYESRKNQGDTAIILQQPYGAIASCLAWQCNFEPYFAYVNFVGNVQENTGYTTFVIQNSLELLRNPGEFYFDKTDKKLYYYPEEGVRIDEAEIVAPVSEGLIRIEGTSTTDRVENLRFSGIKFTYDDKGLEVVENSEGFASVQNMAAYTKYVSNGDWHYWMYNNTDIPKGTVNVENASGIVFSGNVFTTLSSSSCISYMNDVVDSEISGNVFMETSGNSATIGHPQHVHIHDGVEDIDPMVEDNKYPVGKEGICKNIIVTNNHIENICKMYKQADSLTAFFVENVEFSHNRITNVPYAGINFGWGWQNQDDRTNYKGTNWPEYPSKTARKNVIVYNDIDRANQILTGDGGALYTLGQQEDSILAYNNVHGVRSVYTDEGTAYFEIFYNDIDYDNDNQAYNLLWYGNDSYNAGHSFIRWRDSNNNYGTSGVSAINESNLAAPEDIASGAGIEAAWLPEIKRLKKLVASTDDKYTEPPIDQLELLVSEDFENRDTGVLTQEDELLGSFMDGGVSIESEEDGTKILKIQSTDGEYQHNGFYLKGVEYENAVIEMDMRFDESHQFTHDWDAVSVQGFASTAGGEDQLKNNESLFAGSYLDKSNNLKYHYNIGSVGEHINGNQISMSVDKNIWYHVKIMILNSKYYVKMWKNGQEEPEGWQLYEGFPGEVGDKGTLRVATYKHNADSTIALSFDNIKVYGINLQVTPEIASISVNGLSKTEYMIGEELDLTGLEVTAHYSDGTSKPVAVGDCEVTGFDSSTAGEKTIVITYEGKTETFIVTVKESVPAVTVDSISVTGPTRKEYDIGEELDLTGLEVIAHYSDGTSKPVTDYRVSDFDSSVSGEKTVTVTYEDCTAEFTVTVKRTPILESITVVGPDKTKYATGEALSLEGLAVTANYNDGSSKPVAISDCKVTGFDSLKAGIKTVTVTYQDKSDTFEVEVIAPPVLEAITLRGPIKTEYGIGEKLDLTGLVVTARYSDGHEVIITEGFEVTGFDSEKIGKKEVIVSYLGKTAVFEVNITKATMTSITAEGLSKTEYFIGEDLVLDGLVITVHYSDGTSREIRDYEVSGFDSATVGTKIVTISYQGMSTTLEIVVKDNTPSQNPDNTEDQHGTGPDHQSDVSNGQLAQTGDGFSASLACILILLMTGSLVAALLQIKRKKKSI